MQLGTQLPLRALALTLAFSLTPWLAAQDFGPRRELTANPGDVQDVTVADFNGDGFLDAVVSNPSQLLMLPGGPLASFRGKLLILESDEDVQRVDHADLDGDGDLDLLFNAGPLNRLYRLENLGDGSFGPEQLFSGAVANPSGLKTADLDGDGDLDVYSSGTFNGVYWFQNLGGFAFAAAQVLADSSGLTNEPTWVDAGDFDGDGDADFLAPMADDQSLTLWENMGSGVFGPRQVVATTGVAQDFVQSADLDGDGNLDVITLQGTASGGDLSWHLGDGTGSFGAANPIAQFLGSVFEAEVADLDGDGRPDILLGSKNQGQLSWFQNLSSVGSVAFGPQNMISTDLAGLVGFPVVDVDANGTLDVVASSSMQVVSWYSNTGSGLFGAPTPISSLAVGALDALMVDLDGDGLREVVSLSADDQQLAVYAALGGGEFERQQTLATVAPNRLCMDVGDMDGDGDEDIIVGGPGPVPLSWYRNLGTGLVGPAITIVSGSSEVSDVEAVDISGDGLKDLLVASADNNLIYWLRNFPSGGFGSTQLISTITLDVTALKGVDMDQDGDMDALYTAPRQSSPDRVRWSENLGGGNFGDPIQISIQSGARDVVATDVNQDGLMDVIVCGIDTDWYRQLPTGEFTTGVTTTAGFARRIETADVDGDGDSDLLVAKNNRVNWHRKTPFAGWSQAKLIESGLEDPRSARFTDVDGDGDPDVLYAGGQGDTVQWYENLMNPSVGVADCDPAVPNSTGMSGQLAGIGSSSVQVNSLQLVAKDLPLNQVGLFLASPDAGFTPASGGSQGTLCLSGPIGRFREPGQVQSSGSSGALSLSVDLTQIPAPTGFVSILAGEQCTSRCGTAI